MCQYFCKPKLKVGTEWVEKGNTCENAANSVAGIARAIYERTFRIVAEKCNEVSLIGLLEIAIFEISISIFLISEDYLTVIRYYRPSATQR